MAGFTRRDAFILGGIAALMIGWQKIVQTQSAGITFSPVPDAPNWQFASIGDVSGASGNDFLTLGLGDTVAPLPPEQLSSVVHRDAIRGAVPVAVFSDFFCPYCRGLIGRLKARNTAPPISITWHELPLLGQNSVLVARAAEAASLQQGYVAFYDQLLADGFRPSPRWMVTIADRAGLNAARLEADMKGADVDMRLAQTEAAARRLGFFATPGLVISQRAILGALDRDQMEELIAQV